jgi:hypothetical protein
LVIKKPNLAAALLILVCSFSSCTDSRLLNELEAIIRGPENKAPIPNKIDFTREALYPEGVSHDAIGERFLVTSLKFGTIGSVKSMEAIPPLLKTTT